MKGVLLGYKKIKTKSEYVVYELQFSVKMFFGWYEKKVTIERKILLWDLKDYITDKWDYMIEKKVLVKI